MSEDTYLHGAALISSFNVEPKCIQYKETNQGPVVQSIVSLTSLLVRNLLTVVAKVFSDT